jgi:hypothetical protein
MSWLVVPSLSVLLSAFTLLFLRARELVWRAPLDGPRLIDALHAPFAAGEFQAIQAVCERLRSGWAAQVALAALAAVRSGDDLAFALEEACAHWAQVAERHALAIVALGRIALPLALASAIVQLGAGFQTHASLALVEAQLNTALISGSLGLTTLVLCRLGSLRLQRQAQARVREVQWLAESLLSAARPGV